MCGFFPFTSIKGALGNTGLSLSSVPSKDREAGRRAEVGEKRQWAVSSSWPILSFALTSPEPGSTSHWPGVPARLRWWVFCRGPVEHAAQIIILRKEAFGSLFLKQMRAGFPKAHNATMSLHLFLCRTDGARNNLPAEPVKADLVRFITDSASANRVL